MDKSFVHPYIPNSAPDITKEMMKEIGIDDIDELFTDLPVRSETIKLPGPMSEYELRRHIQNIISRSNDELLIFCGAGCWPHYVPAVVDEIINRTEFKTTYTGAPEVEKGKYQALFEYQSLIAELIRMDIVNSSVYDWSTSAGEAASMARRLTGQDEILVPKIISPDRLSVLKTYTGWASGDVITIGYDPKSGKMDIEDLKNKISSKTAAVYIENPSCLGIIEDQGEEIAKITHDHKGVFIVGVDPSSLGVVKPPGEYGADIVVGEAQSLGLHMNYGGNSLGIFGCRDDPDYIDQLPGTVVAVAPTVDGKGKGYFFALSEKRIFLYKRENATSLIGSSSNLCAIGAAVYMSLLGPQGMYELGEGIIQRANYTMNQIANIKGVKTPVFEAAHFKEFVVNFDGIDKTIEEINKVLLKKYGLVVGNDIATEFPELGKCALFCVTEVHTKEDIDKLVFALEEISKGEY